MPLLSTLDILAIGGAQTKELLPLVAILSVR